MCTILKTNTERHTWVYFLLYDKTAQIGEREEHSSK